MILAFLIVIALVAAGVVGWCVGAPAKADES